MMQIVRLIIFLFIGFPLFGEVDLGVDTFFRDGHDKSYRNKRIGLISNQTGVDKRLTPTVEVLRKNGMKVVALFSPEHGWHGSGYAFEKIEDGIVENLPVYSLHGKTRRPNDQMLKGIDLLIYDIQDIGTRSYTYATTLFYVMEEAAKRKIPVLVLIASIALGSPIMHWIYPVRDSITSSPSVTNPPLTKPTTRSFWTATSAILAFA